MAGAMLAAALAAGAAAGAAAAGGYLLAAARREAAGIRQRAVWPAAPACPPQGPLSLLADRFDAGAPGRWLRRELVRANLDLRPAWFALGVLSLMAGAWLLMSRWLGLRFPLDFTLAALVAWLVPRTGLRARRQRLAEQLGAQVSEVAGRLAAGLRAGLTVPQALERVAGEMPAPAGPLLRRVDGELKLGRPLAEVLETLVERAGSDEVRMLATAVLLQRELGGDLAGALETLARALAERQVAAREVAALTAEVRSVAGLLPLMPLLAGLFLNLIQPGFLNVLATPAGLVVLAVFLAFQGAAWLVLRTLAGMRV
ncbi:MAG: type II secretion system F family protein [Bacillota bacterium]